MISNGNSYLLSSRPYLFGCEYGNIITINLFPKGPLGKIVRQVNFSNNRLSEFTELSEYGNKCGYALLSLREIGGIGGGRCNGGGRNSHRFMTANEIPDLFSFLLSNGYKIDTSLTKMMNSSNIQIDTNNIITFITYMQ